MAEAEEPVANWLGAALPRGYVDITSQVNLPGCDLLNAGNTSSHLRALFNVAIPEALRLPGERGSVSAADDSVTSHADDQILLFMPFHSTVKLHTIQITSLPPASDDPGKSVRPGTINLYTNRSHPLDFTEADNTQPTQSITLTTHDWVQGTARIPLRYVKFQNISSLVLYVTCGDGDGPKVRLDRIRLIGESGEPRQPGALVKGPAAMMLRNSMPH